MPAISKSKARAAFSANLANFLYRSGEYEKALKILHHLVELEKEYADGYLKIGNIYYKQHNHEKALEAWEKSLELDPNNEILRNNIKFVKG